MLTSAFFAFWFSIFTLRFSAFLLCGKHQVKAFIRDNNLNTMDDVQSALKELFAETLQSMLEAELDAELGYKKHDVANNGWDAK